jgi:hypothetical protein
MAALLAWSLSLTLAAANPPAADGGALPGQGWVDLDALVRAAPDWQRVEELKSQARALREAADNVAPALLPEVPPDRVPTPPGAQPITGALEDKAAAAERQLLAEALLSEIAADRRRDQAAHSPRLHRELVERLAAAQIAWESWQTALNRDEQLARSNLAEALRTAVARQREDLTAELNVLDATDAAVSGLRRAELEAGVSDALRRSAAQLDRQLDQTSQEGQRRADRAVAQRAAEQAQAAAQLAQMRAQAAQPPGQPPVTIDLTRWRQTMADQTAQLQTRRAADRAAWLAAAAQLDAAAAALAEDLAQKLPGRLALTVTMLAHDAHVELRLTPVPGWPEVTAQVAQRLAAPPAGALP